MKPLTKDQRAAKFASKDAPGLRSRGHRKLTLQEQTALLNELEDQPAQQRLASLRILREAIRSADEQDKNLERLIYERSATEQIGTKEFENVVHILGHLCTIANVSAYWHRLYVIALTNAKQFENALKHCHEPVDEQYITAVLNMDIPLWRLLTSLQKDDTSRQLMDQLIPEVNAYTERLQTAYRHPAQSRRA